MVRIATFAGSVLVGLAFFVFAQEGPPQKNIGGKNTGTALRSTAARKALAERIEVPEEFRKPGQPIPLRSFLSHIDEVLADRKQNLPFVIDDTSFKDANMGDPLDLLDSPVSFPPFMKTASVQELLEIALRQVPTRNATFIVRNGRIEIMTHEAAGIQSLVDKGVTTQFRDVPLKIAIEDLADQMGFTVMIDPRCGAALSTSVSLQSQNDISARGILSSWADMFDLKLLVNDHRVLLMPRTDYIKKLQEQAEEAHLVDRTGAKLPGASLTDDYFVPGRPRFNRGLPAAMIQ